jgi:hypothetical protein
LSSAFLSTTLAHQTCVYQIQSVSIIDELAHILDTCKSMTDLRLHFSDDWMDIEDGFDLFTTLFVRPAGKKLGDNIKLFTAECWLSKLREFSALNPAIPIFENLDCLTLYQVSDREILTRFAECESLRIRKFRWRGMLWHHAREIIGNGRLEVLEIQIELPGRMDYEALIPLVLKSSTKLRLLRLEWAPGIPTNPPNREQLSQVLANELVMKCHELQHLSLRADLDNGVWVCTLSLPSLTIALTDGNRSPSQRSYPSGVAASSLSHYIVAHRKISLPLKLLPGRRGPVRNPRRSSGKPPTSARREWQVPISTWRRVGERIISSAG